MAGITLEQAQTQLDGWLTASTALQSSESYEIDTGNGRRKLTRSNAEMVLAQIKFWQDKVNLLTTATAGGRRRVRYVVPDFE